MITSMCFRRRQLKEFCLLGIAVCLCIYLYEWTGSNHASKKRGLTSMKTTCFYNESQEIFNTSKWNLPPVPKNSLNNDTIGQVSFEVIEYFTVLNRTLCQDFVVLILTPIHNSEHEMKSYVDLIKSLDYPRHLLSLSFGEDGSRDNTLAKARIAADEIKATGFRRADVYHLNLTGRTEDSWGFEHARGNQLQRRSHLAKARNLLLKEALRDEDYVLWLDSDMRTAPSDLIQQMIHADKDVVSASCLFKDGRGKLRVYDKNTWRETTESLQKQKGLPKGHLIVEGYGPSMRIYLPHLRGEGKRIVPIDGVGGCSLLIKAESHRKGLHFPEKLFERHIETEGLAKMAKYMGYSVYGLPFVNVFHS